MAVTETATSVARQRADRALAERHAGYVAEVERIIDATYRVIARTGSVDPTVRDILREADLSTPAFYRHFRSKDELFVVLLDDGRRRLADTIARRIAREPSGIGRLRAWVTGMLAQALDTSSAARTRPFMASLERLAERFPDELRVSEQVLIDQLLGVLIESPDLATADARADATAIYHLTIGALGWHLRNRSTPRSDEIEHLVRFASRALTPHQHIDLTGGNHERSTSLR